MKSIILLDSGSTHHMTRSASTLKDFVACGSDAMGNVNLGNGHTVTIIGYGNRYPLGNILVVPDLIVDTIISWGGIRSWRL